MTKINSSILQKQSMRNEKKAYHMLLTIIDMLDEESNLQTPVLQVSGNGQTVAVHMDISMVM